MKDLRHSVPVLLGSLALLHGCATLEPETEPDWKSATRGLDLAETDATADGSRLLIGNPSTVILVDGDTGRTTGGIGQGRMMQITVHADIGDKRISYPLRSETSNSVMLPEAERVLVLDYQDARERVIALDMASGAEAWRAEHYSFSLQQYETFLEEGLDHLAQGLASALGGNVETESDEDRRERQYHFAQHLFAPVNNGANILFKTFDGLVMLNAETGSEQWRVEDFGGPGIREARQLDNGDYLVLSTPRDLSRLQAAATYSLARISARGEVRWISEHSGEGTVGMTLAGNRVVVDGSPMQVFDLGSGEKLWENEIYRMEDQQDPRALPQPEPLYAGGILYQAATTIGEDGVMVGLGNPHRVNAHDPDTGERHWYTEETNTFFGELQRIDGDLLVWGAGEFFGEGNGAGVAALDAETGAVQWRSPQTDTPGLLAQAPWITEPVFDDPHERVFLGLAEELFGMRIGDGEQVLDVDLSETKTGNVVGLAAHEDSVVVVGQEGVAAFDMDTGEVRFEVETPHVVDFDYAGDRIVLHIAATVMGAPEETSRGLLAVDPADGTRGDLVAWDYDGEYYLGVFEDGYAFIGEDGKHAWVLGEDGHLKRFSL